MAQPGKYLSVFVPAKLLEHIEDFRFRERIHSRVEAIRVLVIQRLIDIGQLKKADQEQVKVKPLKVAHKRKG